MSAAHSNQNLYENTIENWSLDRQTKVPAQGHLASMTFFCVGNIYVYKVCPRNNKAFDYHTSEERYGHFYCKYVSSGTRG